MAHAHRYRIDGSVLMISAAGVRSAFPW